MAKLILSVTGSDKPGLTRALAEAVQAAGGNWLQSHLSRLGGLYVGSVLVELDEANIDGLKGAVRAVDETGLAVRISPAVSDGADPGEEITLNVVGADRPGIVRLVTTALSALSVNIEDLDTRIVPEVQTGAPLFSMQARLRLPPGLAAPAVQDALEAISAEIMVDIEFGRG